MTPDMEAKLNELLAAAAPGWALGTLVLTDPAGEVVGCGRLERTAAGLTLALAPAPQGVASLAHRPPRANA